MNSIGKSLIIVGTIIFTLGVIFSLQSKSVIGPSSSFMYDNPEWAVNGSIIIASGIIVVTVGGVIILFSKRKRKACD